MLGGATCPGEFTSKSPCRKRLYRRDAPDTERSIAERTRQRAGGCIPDTELPAKAIERAIF